MRDAFVSVSSTPSAAPPSWVGGGRVTVDRAALKSNWRALASRTPSAACAAVVKANAYGLGIDVAVPAFLEAGCGTFFVAQLDEALRVRKLAPRAVVYVLNGLPPGCAQQFAEAQLRPVLGSVEEVIEWAGFLRASGWRGGAALHIDTGINRLGLRMEEARDLAEAAERPPLSLVMSHLACAEDPDHPLNRRQIEAFATIRQSFAGTPASLANSSGLFLPDPIAFDLVRPGYALYGGNPTPGQRNPMRHVVTLEARIVQVRDVSIGDTVGYGAGWTARRPSRIAVLAIGYADGSLRSGSGLDQQSGAEVVVAGTRRPVIGRISMDLTAVDVTGLASSEVHRGAVVQVIGPDIPLDEVAARAGTIGYEVLTRLGDRLHRSTTD